MKKDIIEALKHIGVALVAALVLIGSAQVWSGFLFIVPPAVCGFGGWLATKKLNVALGWAGLGFVAGVLFFIAV